MDEQDVFNYLLDYVKNAHAGVAFSSLSVRDYMLLALQIGTNNRYCQRFGAACAWAIGLVDTLGLLLSNGSGSE